MKDARAATGSGDHQPAAGVSPRPGRTGRRGLLALGALAAALLTTDPAGAQPYPRVIILLSQTARGFSADGQSNTPAVNLNGLVTDYSSNALNLVAQQPQNMIEQVYARQPDLVTSELVSKGPDGKAGLGPSQKDSPYAPGISGDGRYIGFSSLAPNLVADAFNGQGQIFVYDRSQGSTELISRGIDGKPGNGLSDFPRLSTDGRYVVFESVATNLVAEDTNGVSEIFLFDRQTKMMQIVSVASDLTLGNAGSITPSISEDGNVVAFASTATNLVSQSTLGFQQAFVHELQSGTTELVSVSSSGAVGNDASYYPALSRDGSLVAFKSAASNLVSHDTNDEPDVFVRDRPKGTTQRVSVPMGVGIEADGLSGGPGISADGRFVAFPSFASNLVPEDGDGVSDVFVYDRANSLIARVTVGMNGTEPNNGVSDFPVTISADGRWIGFASAASNLVPHDNNGEPDAFLACNPFDEFSCAAPTPTPTPPGVTPCVGDCNGDGMVTVDELILMVNIALELSPLCPTGGSSGCLAGDANCDCQITVDEIIRAIDNALVGCHQYTDCTLDQEQQMCCEAPPTIGTATATPTRTSPLSGTATVTPTPPTPTATATTSTAPLCVGDCNGTGMVTVDNLVRMVGIALAEQSICPSDGSNGCLAGDSNCDCQITVDEIIQAVDNALNGCGIFNTCNPTEHEAMCCP